jgi:hypothetical protein
VPTAIRFETAVAQPFCTKSYNIFPYDAVPPTPGSDTLGSPKWPISHPCSPSTGSESHEDVDQLAGDNMDIDEAGQSRAMPAHDESE